MLGVSGVAAITAFLLLRQADDVATTLALLSTAVFFVMWGSLYWTFPPVLAPEGRAGLVGGVINSPVAVAASRPRSSSERSSRRWAATTS